MDDLKKCSLDELISVVIQEGLIDSCERNDDKIVIVQGATRFVLNPVRAHAFLRGVIKGMSVGYRRRRDCDAEYGDAGGPDRLDRIKRDLPPQGDIVNSFRRHILKKWWSRYDEANRPFGSSSTGLMLWVRHDTKTTSN